MSKRIANAESDPGDILALEIIHYRQSGRGRQFLETALRKAEALRNKSVGAKRDHLSAKIKEAKALLRKKNPGIFGSEAVAKAKRVTKIRRVRHRDTGQLGEITGSAPQGWVKVKWDNRDKATLIKRSEIVLARGKRNPAMTENQAAWRKGYEHGYKGLHSRPDYPKVGLAGSYAHGYAAGERRRKGKAQPRKNPKRLHRKHSPMETLRRTPADIRAKLKGIKIERDHGFLLVHDFTGAPRNWLHEVSVRSVNKGAKERLEELGYKYSFGGGAGTNAIYDKAYSLSTAKLPLDKHDPHKVSERYLSNPKREAKTSKDAFGVTHENPNLPSKDLEYGSGQRYDIFVNGQYVESAGEKAAFAARAVQQWRKISKKTDRVTWRIVGQKKNPSVAAIAEKFQGKTDGAIEEFHASSLAPANLARAGKLVFLKVGAKTFRLPGAMVAIAPNEKLWIVSKRAPVFSTKAKPGEGLDVGEITQICYETAKQHIGDGKRFEYVHEFGEDGGKRPHLIIDHEGMPILHGGDYKIRAEGIVN